MLLKRGNLRPDEPLSWYSDFSYLPTYVWLRGRKEPFGFTVPFNNMRTLKFKAQPTNAFFRYRQSNVRRLLPAFDCCRARDNQIAVHSSDNEQSSAVVISWEDPPNIWLMAAKNAFVGRLFNFRVRRLLKSAVMGSSKNWRCESARFQF